MSEMKLTSLTSQADDCTGCGSCVGRRDFLRTGLGAAAVAALAALLPTDAGAAPVRWTRSLGRGGELRYAVPTADGVDIDRSNELILVRHAGVVTAFALSCPHQRSMLRWREGDGIFQCTKHHSEYDPMGVFQKGRATRNMDRLLIRREGDELVVDPSTIYQSDEDPQGWASAALKVG
jgi:nitrite reductase/ring-hydroxylating ferredoxin subunit